MTEWDYADYLMRVIGDEVKNRDFRAVEAGIRVLATVDPRKAQDVYDAIQAGLTIRAFQEGRSDG